MEKKRIEELVGLVIAAALLIGMGSLILAVVMLFSAQWVAASILMLAAAVTFSGFLRLLFN
ncbi:MAG: hypothetical protein PVH60_00685 [Anaerolineales bacterium]|jgi:hypothetical protein